MKMIVDVLFVITFVFVDDVLKYFFRRENFSVFHFILREREILGEERIFNF